MTAPMIVQTTIQQTDYAVSVADPGSSFTVACTTEQTTYDVTVENTPGPEGPRGPAGLTMRGAWDSATTYAVDDAVFYGGSSWWAVTANVGVQPDTDGGAYWEMLAQAGTVQDVTAADSTVTVGGTAAHPTVAANVGTTAGTVAAGDDARITGAAQKASNLSDLANAATARANLGLGVAATRNVGTAAGTVADGGDARFTDSRTPTGTAGGDLSGTYPNPAVAKVNGVAVSGTPAAGNVLTATSGTAATWQSPGAPTWTTPSLTNGSAPAGYQAPRYCKDAAGFVHVEGCWTGGGAAGTPVAVFTLPAGYRPAGKLVFPTAPNNQSYYPATVTVDTAGVVSVIANGSNYGSAIIWGLQLIFGAA